jgi:hypothetical protein
MSHADQPERRDPVATDTRRDDTLRRDDSLRREDRGLDDRDRGLDDRDRGLDDRDRGLDDRDRRDRDRSVGIEERWEATQTHFLESPREAVAAADELVSEVIDDVRRRLDGERAAVADTWRRDGADTEDLRTAMLRYREVLDRLSPQR